MVFHGAPHSSQLLTNEDQDVKVLTNRNQGFGQKYGQNWPPGQHFHVHVTPTGVAQDNLEQSVNYALFSHLQDDCDLSVTIKCTLRRTQGENYALFSHLQGDCDLPITLKCTLRKTQCENMRI